MLILLGYGRRLQEMMHEVSFGLTQHLRDTLRRQERFVTS